MKRKIKFRGKRIDNGEWVYGSYQAGKGKNPHVISWWFVHQHEDEISDCVDVAEVIPETVGQYTGLKDNNGTEIYEEDIMKITYDTNYNEHPHYIGYVEYKCNQDYSAFDLTPWIDCEMNALSWLKSESDQSVISYNVIGNVHDNPELISR